jgi:hypothetical protein
MNLLALANFICGKVSQSAAEDVTACKGFLQRRFEMLWQDQLWKESIVQYTQTISSQNYTPLSTWLPVKQVLLLPPTIERVLALRTGDRHLNVQVQPHYFRMDFDQFNQKGAVCEFLNLPKAVWEFDTAQNLWLLTDAAEDITATLTIDLLAADGATVNRVQAQTGVSEMVNVGESDLVGALLKPETHAAVSLGYGSLSVQSTRTIVRNSIPAEEVSPNAFLYLINGAGVLVSTLIIPTGESVAVDLAALGATHITEQIDPPILTAIPGGTAFLGVIDFVSLADDPAKFVFTASSPSDTRPSTLLTVAAADTIAAKRCRIKLIGVPDDGTVLRVLGKAAAPTFSNDNDEPGLSGVQNCLIAFVQADMLQRERQYSKAQALQLEGQALLDQFKRQEVVQQAHHQRIIPEDGYGNPYDLWSHPPLSY